jgi:NAD(P) transhydrogenase subunit alpha
MTRDVVLGLYVFALAIFVGYEVIARVPSALHTPLMSATNAIHGVVLLGAIMIAGTAESTISHVLGFIALVLGAANVFGGFVVTERMLGLFRKSDRHNTT